MSRGPPCVPNPCNANQFVYLEEREISSSESSKDPIKVVVKVDEGSKSCCKCESSSGECCCESSCSDKFMGTTFMIRTGKKKQHPWCERIIDKGAHAIEVTDRCGNKCSGADIHLSMGRTYAFDVNLKHGDKFFLTEDCQGGKKGVGCKDHHYKAKPLCDSFKPINCGVVYYTVTCDTPKKFYYQSSKHRCCGGLVIVHSR